MHRSKPSGIEVWAVCDDDSRKPGYHELQTYAHKKDVKLAFSRWKIESYFLQYGTQSKIAKDRDIDRAIDAMAKKYGRSEGYNKTDLGWLETLIEENIHVLRTAIINCNQRIRTTDNPFFTVQKLLERMIELSQYSGEI